MALSRQNWSDDGHDEPIFLFPDDEESDFDAVPSVNGGSDKGGAVPPGASDNVEYDLRAADPTDKAEDNRRRTGSRSPVEYPEGSLGAFSTPEDYEAHTGADDEYDSPILLFPPDEVEDEEEENDTRSRNRLSSSTDDGDLDDSIGISFSRYSAENKEGEFFFMPFLDIPDEIEDDEDEDDGEEISFSFSKVDAEQVKKEKEFIFMPFLNISDNPAEDEEEEDEEHIRHRSSKGTIFDEGLYLIPLESEEEEEETEKEKEEEPEEEDSGIYVVSSVGGVVPKAPEVPKPKERKTTLRSEPAAPAGQKKKKKTPPKQGQSSGKKQPSKSGSKTGKSSNGKLNAAEEQFRKAMRNVNPEIRAAVKNDPVQRAALEQAVRIALVQQAAQEAVEKATGRPVFGGSSAASGKKKRIPKPPQRQQPMNSFLGGSSRASSMSFSPITLRTPYDDGGVSEFGVTDDKKGGVSEFGASAGSAQTSATEEKKDAQSAGAAASSAAEAQDVAPDSSQDPTLNALSGKNDPRPRSTYQSPAAVRAAMRTGIDFDSLQPSGGAAAAAAPKPAMSAAEQELQAKRSGCLMWIIVAFVAFFIGLIGILVLPNISKQNKFDKANDLMDRGQYIQAIEIFDDFKAADKKFYEDCRKKISECAYMQAEQYFAEGKYYDAYNLLMDHATVNDDTRALALKCNYYYAEQRYAEGDWQTAAAAYSILAGSQYEDSQEKYNICQYQLATQYADQGNYMQAHQSFAMLGDYSDSAYRAACMVYKSWEADNTSVSMGQLAGAAATLNENASNGEALDMLNGIYNRATGYAAQGNHKIAFETYEALGNYSDSAYKAALSLHGLWETEPDYGTISQREKAMNELRARMGNDIAAAALNSSGFNPVRLMGEWTDGQSRMSLQRVSPESEELVLKLELRNNDESMNTVEGTSVGFEGNVMYQQSDPNDSSTRKLLIEITGIDSLVTAEPGAFTFYCFLNNREYEFTRS